MRNALPDDKKLTFRQYFIFNKSTSIYCLKVSSLIFGVIATLIAVGVEFNTGVQEDPLTVFIICELFGYGLGTFIFIIAIFEGYTKARQTINQFNNIDVHLKQQLSIQLVKRPLNPKYWFIQFDIVGKDGDKYYTIDELFKLRLT